MGQGFRSSRVMRRLPLKLLTLALISLYAFLTAFHLLCAFHPVDRADHEHQGGLHGLCSWVQKIASAYLTPTRPLLPFVGLLLLSFISFSFLRRDPFLPPPSIRAPPLSLS